MKTITKIMAMVLLSCTMLFNQTAFAQYPVKGAPLWGIPAGVDEGLLQDPDQKTKPIWFKVNGNIVGQQPHNKLHNPGNTGKAGSYVPAGAYVDVNFNVNKNVANRYSLVSYTIAPDGTRNIFDYQSNIYNQNTPVQGNSNQQLVLVPTNCPFEVYFVKGAVVESFPASGTQDLITGPTDNPYAYDAGILRTDNRILGFTFGDGAQGAICELCPVVNNSANDQVFTRLLEVIEQANGDMEMLFAVINTNGTTAAPYTAGGKDFELIGDILFSGITPTHTQNNQPYQFRANYQLGPVLANYTVGNPIAFGPKDAFVFDQRNNHSILAFDTYQSEVVRFKVSATEYARLSDPIVAPSPAPEICVELSSKHPEPHKTLVPIYCATMDFDCGPTDCPTTGTDCERVDCAFSYIQGTTIAYGDLGVYQPDFLIFNDTGKDVLSVNFTMPLMTATEAAAMQASASYAATDGLTTFNVSTISDATTTTLRFTQVGDNWDQFEDISFTFQAPQAIINSAAGQVTMTMVTTAGSFEQIWNILDEECGIVTLPVELISFTGKGTNEGIALNWKTASEKNNDRFEIERSIDGKNFEKIGTLKGKGNSSALNTYGFVDKQPMNGLNYYRLNQVDFDGTNAYSQVIKVNSEKRSTGLAVQLIPNPCSDQNCSIVLKGADASKALTVEMRDLTGRLIFSQQVPADQGSFNLPKAGYGKGIYIISAKNGLNYTYQKVIIQ